MDFGYSGPEYTSGTAKWSQPDTPATILGDPNDPSLGSTYEDGVERARRVKKKKQLAAGVGDADAAASAPLPKHLQMVRDISALVLGDRGTYPRQMLGELDPRRTVMRTILGG